MVKDLKLIKFKNSGTISKVRISSINYVNFKDYIHIHNSGEYIERKICLACSPMKNENFIQIHKSYAVNSCCY